jgi:hypothetical protein
MTTQWMRDFEPTESWEKSLTEFSGFLGLEEPIPDEVFNRALNDSKYASYLYNTRGNEHLLNMVIKDPRNSEYIIEKPGLDMSNTQLAKKAFKATKDWAKSGFKETDKAERERRLDICMSCEYLTNAPDKAVYKIKFVKKSTDKICGSCGCGVANKIKMSTENCPVADKNDPTISRWGLALAETLV